LHGLSMKKTLNDCEIRLVMHVLSKKFDTRRQFMSQKEIAKAMFDQAKCIDSDLPFWPYVQDVATAAVQSAETVPRLREVRKDGKIPDSELIEVGIKPGVCIVDAAQNEYTVVAFDTSLDKVTIKANEGEPIEVDRLQIKREYAVKLAEEQSVVHESMTDGIAESNGFIGEIWQAIVKAKMKDELDNHSHESEITIHEKPKVSVSVKRNFKAGNLVLVGFTPHVFTTSKPLGDAAAVYRVKRNMSDDDNDKVAVAIRKCLDFPKTNTASGVARAEQIPFVSGFWAIQEITSSALANCMLEMKEITVKFLKEDYTFDCPIIRNTRDLKANDKLLLDKDVATRFRSKYNVDKEPTKKRKAEEALSSKGNGKGKGKGKGKAKNKSSKKG
jgi:hypothetical protein